MNDEIKVSINCITYNHQEYIEEAIQSFLMQKTDFKYEILIHDDASTDLTQDIIRKYQEMYPDIIKPYFQKENQLSKGVRRINYKFNHTKSKGKYIALCEGDDYWTDPYKLQKQVDFMEENTNCTLCAHAVDGVMAIGGEIIPNFIRSNNFSSYLPTSHVIAKGGGFIGTNSIVYRKEVFDNPPDWYFDAPVGDYPLQIFLAIKGDVYYMDERMSAYRINVPGSWTNREYLTIKRIDHFRDISKMLDQINDYTNYKYDAEIELTKSYNLKNVILYGCNILLKNGRVDKMTTGRFKKFYNQLENEDKIKLEVIGKNIKL